MNRKKTEIEKRVLSMLRAGMLPGQIMQVVRENLAKSGGARPSERAMTLTSYSIAVDRYAPRYVQSATDGEKLPDPRVQVRWLKSTPCHSCGFDKRVASIHVPIGESEDGSDRWRSIALCARCLDAVTHAAGGAR